MMLGNSVGTLGFTGPYAHLASKGVEIGMTSEDLKLTYTIFGICGIIGRLSGGILGDKFGTLNVFIIGMFLLGCCNLGVGLAESGPILTLCLAGMGISSGPFIALSAPMMAELFGVMRIAQVMGTMFPLMCPLMFLSSFCLGAI